MIRHLCIYALLMVAFAFTTCAEDMINSRNFSVDFPSANSKNNKIIGFVLSFNYNHIDSLMAILSEYTSMCEGGWDTTVVIFTTLERTPMMMRYMNDKTYCYRLGMSIPIRVDIHDQSVGTELAAKHRKILREELDNFDVFLYHEDDMLFRYPHLVAYLTETQRLHELDPIAGLRDNVIGFQRYRRQPRGFPLDSNFPEQATFGQEFFEEVPHIRHICIKDQPYLHMTGDTHQALWIFTRSQLLYLQTKCQFLDHTSSSREFMSSMLIFDHKSNLCSMNKLIPGEQLRTFSVLHYYPKHHNQSKVQLFLGDENIRAGYDYQGRPFEVRVDRPPCWEAVTQRSEAQQRAEHLQQQQQQKQ